jgi:hypothetical protein
MWNYTHCFFAFSLHDASTISWIHHIIIHYYMTEFLYPFKTTHHPLEDAWMMWNLKKNESSLVTTCGAIFCSQNRLYLFWFFLKLTNTYKVILKCEFCLRNNKQPKENRITGSPHDEKKLVNNFTHNFSLHQEDIALKKQSFIFEKF